MRYVVVCNHCAEAIVDVYMTADVAVGEAVRAATPLVELAGGRVVERDLKPTQHYCNICKEKVQ